MMQPYINLKSALRLFAFLVTLITQLTTPAQTQTSVHTRNAKIQIGKGTAVGLGGNLFNDTTSVIRNSGVIGYSDVVKNYGTIELSDTASVLTIDSNLHLEKGMVRLNQNVLKIFNKDTSAIKRVNGYLIAENSKWGKVRWYVGENTGRYKIPFVNDSLQDITVELEIQEAGVGNGYIEISTYGTAEENSPKPGELQHYPVASAMIDSNALKIVDRYWVLRAEGFSQIPVIKLILKYSDFEIDSSNQIVEQNLTASVLAYNCWAWKPLFGIVDTVNNLFTIDSLNEFSVFILYDSSLNLIAQTNLIADGGSNQTVVIGNGVQIGAPYIPWLSYSWEPATGLDNQYNPDPIASPDSTTTYFLTVTDTNLCINTDSVTVTVISDEMCGFGAVESILSEDTAYVNAMKEQEDMVREYINNQFAQRSPLSTYTIPVVVHVLHPGHGYGTGLNISYEQIQWQINALNAAFANSYPDYNQQASGDWAVNTDISFCLAGTPAPDTINWSIAPDSTVERGVMRYVTYSAFALDPYSDNTRDTALLNITHPDSTYFPFNNYLNIWLVRHIDRTAIPGTIGYAYRPAPQNPPMDGVVFRADAFGDNSIPGNNFDLPYPQEGKILAHEVGHYLDLLHTFAPDSVRPNYICAGTRDTTQTDRCDKFGDRICDTPPTTTTEFNCIDTVPNTCFDSLPAFAYINQDDMIENFMSYADDVCMNTFTNLQTAWMHGILNVNPRRFNLWQPANLAATGVLGTEGCATCILSANISHFPNVPCLNDTVQFTTPDGPAFCATSWLWNFGDGDTATLRTPTHMYTVTGDYTVTLIASDSVGNEAFDTILLRVGATAEITAVSANTVCFSSEQSITITFQGTPPFTAVISNGTTLDTITSNYFTAIYNVTLSTPDPFFFLTQMSDSSCGSGDVSPDTTWFVTLCCDTNLVRNGDFEIGDTLFFTTHTSVNLGMTVNEYAVTDSASRHNEDYFGGTNHTQGGNLFLLCDVSPSNNRVIWQDTIDVLQNHDYMFSAFFNNAELIVWPSNDDPCMFLTVNGVTVAGPFCLSEIPDAWINLLGIWNSGTSTTAILEIEAANTTGTSTGVDICIDDIVFRRIGLACTTNGDTISGTETWTSTTVTFCDDLLIPGGATLILEDTRLEFARSNSQGQPVNLIIQPGGRLEMYNSVLTNISGCDEMWRGVEVYAIPNANPNDFSQNGAIITAQSDTNTNEISNADIGINTRSTGWFGFAGGGILRISRTNFINNRISISLLGALYKSSTIEYCFFSWNSNRLFTPGAYISHLNMFLAGQIPISKSVFNNLTSTGLRGNGINGFVSNGIHVFDCAFADLENGISITNGNGINYVTGGSEFTNNDFGIKAIGVSNLRVEGDPDFNFPNIFNVPDVTDHDVAGIHVENSTGLEIKYNQFIGNATAPCGSGPCSYGIVTDNTNDAAGRIFRNDFNSIYDDSTQTTKGVNFGLQTEGHNSDLSIRCNRFELDPDPVQNQHGPGTHPDYAWASLTTEYFSLFMCIMVPHPITPGLFIPMCGTFNFPWGVLKNQGNSGCFTRHEDAAGNRWMTNDDTSNTCPTALPGLNKDIFVEQNVFPFEYFHHRRDDIGNKKVIPECASAWWVTAQRRTECTGVDEATWPGSCLDSENGLRIMHPDSTDDNDWETLDDMQEKYDEYALKKQQLEEDADSLRALLDGGNMADLYDSIFNMSFSLSKKDTILRRNSPLSDDMLLAVLLEKVYDVHPLYYKDELRDLLVLNVPLSNKVIGVVFMEGIYMGEEHTDSVMYANANGTFDSLRMAYIDTLATAKYYDSEMRLVENDLRFWNGYRDALDTTGTLDYYKTYLRSAYTYTSKKLLAELLLNQEEWEDAQDVLDTVWMLSAAEDSLETAWFTDYMELMSEVGQQEGSITNMDSAQKAQMYSIAENGAHVAPKAQAILYLVDTTTFEYLIEKIEYGGGQKWSNATEKKIEQQVPESHENIGYKLYPNPNDGRMTLEYALEDEKGKFLLFDARGKLLSDIELIKGSHKITIEQKDLGNGIYLFNITNSKTTLLNGKIVIIK